MFGLTQDIKPVKTIATHEGIGIMIAKCPCQQCGVNIEFEAENAGQFVACPSCGRDTRLILPNTGFKENPKTAPSKLMACTCCEAPISKRARACPQCGERTGTGSGILSVTLAVIAGMIMIINSCGEHAETIMQQIYLQLEFIGGMILIGLSMILNELRK